MATDSIVRKNLLFLTGTTSASFMSLWRLDHPGPCSQRGSACGPIICCLCCESLTAFWTKYPHFYFAMCPSHYAANREDFIYCHWIKGTPQTSSNTGRLPWELCDTITLSWQRAGCSESTPPPQVQISVWVLLVKIQHVSTYKRSTTLIQLKIPEQNIKWNSCTFFLQTPPSGYSFLFILASDSLFGSKLIWVVILIISLLSALKGWFLLQEGNSLLLIACCKDAELADRKCCLLYTRSMVQRTNVLYLNKQPRWGQPKAFPLCLWHSK